MTEPKKKIYAFFITEELARGLKAMKRRTGAPEGETVRRAIDAYLREHGIIKADRKRASTRKRP